MEKQSPTDNLAEDFRASLKDFVVIAQRLAPFCPTVADLLRVVQLGAEDDSQLAFLINLVRTSPAKR